MTPEQFELALRRGLGRAVLWLLRGEIAADRDLLLHACTHNLAYWLQSADERALYMFDIIQATKEPEFYACAIERNLAELSDDETDWKNDERSVDQMFNLLGRLVKSGDYAGRQFFYSFFEKHAAGSDYSRAEALIDVDGLDGYLFVARQWILHPRLKAYHWSEAWLLEDVVKRFGEEETWLFLTNAALTEPVIGPYLAEVKEKQSTWHKRQNSPPRRDRLDYAKLRRRIFNPKKDKGYIPWHRWGATLSEDDAEKLAAELVTETDLEYLERYLRLFHRRPFPLDHAPLLALARQRHLRIAAAARAALARIEHPSVHDLALELMETDPHPWELVELLVRNFCEGDENILERVLENLTDVNDLERVGIKIRQVFEENLTPSATKVLLLVYELGYCTLCRHGIVELLDELGQLPSHIVEEGRYDADKDIREMMQESRRFRNEIT